MNNNFEKLKNILGDKFGVPTDQITLSSDLSGDLNLSNLEINDLTGIVTSGFDLLIPEGHEVEKIKTVSDLINFIDTFSQEL